MPGVDPRAAGFAIGVDAAGDEVAVVVVDGEVVAVGGVVGGGGRVFGFGLDFVGFGPLAFVAAEEVEACVGGRWWFGFGRHVGGGGWGGEDVGLPEMGLTIEVRM